MRKITTILITFTFVILGVWFLQNNLTRAAQAAPSTPPSAMSNNSYPNDLSPVEWASIRAQLVANASANSSWLQQAKLTASDGVENDQFSYSVAISGDTIVVGAYADNGLSGAAYIFVKPGSGWSDMTQIAKLTASDSAMGDRFGISVAISGDAIVVGADFDDDNGADSGSAYVFVKPGSGWSDMTQTAKLTTNDGESFDHFGDSVANSGDMVVVGAWGDDDNGADSGSAYVFGKPGGGWSDMTQTAKLTAADGTAGDEFSRYSVAVSGDTVVIGAYQDDDNGTSSGSAYVFVKPGGGWSDMTQTAKLIASDGAAFDWFGDSVAVSGDTVIAGAPLNDSSGSVYVFVKPGGIWSDMTQTAKLTASDGMAGDNFGGSLSVSSDTVLVGASGDDGNFFNSGSAYIFVKPGGSWSDMTQTSKLTVADGTVDDWFGNSVAISGDTVVIGTVGDDDNGTDSGSAYIFSANPEYKVYLPTIIKP